MAAVINDFMAQQLLSRRHRLEHAAAKSIHSTRLESLLREVDDALARVDAGTYGICDVCHEPVECDRLIADPLVRFCLDHLNSEERDALERDLQLAAQVQRGLLPSPELNCRAWHVSYHYEPAGIVSGDYCDVVDAGERGLYFMVGDVSGKGVAASMLMAHLHAMFRALISVDMPLKCMLEHASRVFCESTLPTHYATLVCGRALDDGRVEICNAGHPHPLVARDGRVTPLESSNLAVGMFCNAEFSVSELLLDPGHNVLIYSDGVSEATDDFGNDYGHDRLCELIAAARFAAPSALIAACRDDLKSFRGRQRCDDVTIFALGRGEC
jgi:sigma-B regulation protein RsbU (phosphoserine phosphatase)